jgi:hypothetical protein
MTHPSTIPNDVIKHYTEPNGQDSLEKEQQTSPSEASGSRMSPLETGGPFIVNPEGRAWPGTRGRAEMLDISRLELFHPVC